MTNEHELGRGDTLDVMKELENAFVPDIPAENIANARGLVAFLVSASMDDEPASPDMVRGNRLVFALLDIILLQIEQQFLDAGPDDLPKLAAATSRAK